MFDHYFVSALRNFARNKVSTAISIFGLTLGVLCLIAAFGFAYILTHSDQNFAKSDRIYFVEEQRGNIATPPELANYISSEFPELEAIAGLRSAGEAPLSAGGHAAFAGLSVADPAFLRIFNLPFVAGDAQHALDRPRSIVLKQATAQLLFGTINAVGRSISVRGRDLTVTGVMGDIPQPSHLATVGLGEIVSVDVDQELNPRTFICHWNCFFGPTYVLFPAGNRLSLDGFNQRLAALSARVIPPDRQLSYSARPISEIGATTLNMAGTMLLGIRTDVLVLILGGLIAVLACINYANLVTAQIMDRAKEIGLRKVVGAEQRHLLAQHLLEAGLQVAGAYVVAALLLALSSPFVTRLLGFNIFSYFAAQPATWLFLVISSLLVTLVAGVFPVLAVLRIRPEAAIRTGKGVRGRHRSGRVLVGIQFGIVSLLLIVALVMVLENQLLRKTGLESMGDQVVVISDDLKEAGVSLSALRNEVSHGPGVLGVSAMQFKPWSFGSWSEEFQRNPTSGGKTPDAIGYAIADNFFETMDFKLLAGRIFLADRAEDVWHDEPDAGQSAGHAASGARNILVNEVLAAQLGWTPQQAVGQTVYQPNGPDGKKQSPPPIHIIGVVANRPLNFAMVPSPAFYAYEPQSAQLSLIRLDRRDIPAGLAAIDAAWAKLAPTTPLKREFMDDLFRSSYSYFTAIDAVIFALAAFAFAIAAAGLIGMATFAVTRLRREIGIRKTLGSTVQQALTLVLWNFSKPVVIANVVAWPLAYLVAQVYLSLFAVRITLTPVPFVLGFLIALAMTWLSVGWHAWRAARVNPAEVLHYE